MPRLSLYRPNKTNDYKYIDNIIREQFNVGCSDVYIHEYVGHNDASGNEVPVNPNPDEIEVQVPIEDLLFLENRNRNYSENVLVMRGHFNVVDLEFDLSQFGLFVQGDTLYMQFHYNTMIEQIGRKFMNGDVIEIPILMDEHPLNQLIPMPLPKFYVVQDGSFAAEGFSQTWLPHVWRCKLVPMRGGQEYEDILNNCMDKGEENIDGDNGECNNSCTLGEWMCQHNDNMYINDANMKEAINEVPLSGYENDMYYLMPPDDNESYTKEGSGYESFITTFDYSDVNIDNTTFDTENTTWIEYELNSVIANQEKENGFLVGYLTGNALPPNGAPFSVGVTFPSNPEKGDYFLRKDYKPERLFQFNGTLWATIESAVRTDMYLGDTVKTQRSGFVNNTDTVQTTDRGKIPSSQTLDELLRPKEDN